MSDFSIVINGGYTIPIEKFRVRGLACSFRPLRSGLPYIGPQTVLHIPSVLPLFENHDRTRRIGFGKIARTATGLMLDATVKLNPDSPRDAMTLVNRDNLRWLSLTYTFSRNEDRPPAPLREATIQECSVCFEGADELARCTWGAR